MNGFGRHNNDGSDVTTEIAGHEEIRKSFLQLGHLNQSFKVLQVARLLVKQSQGFVLLDEPFAMPDQRVDRQTCNNNNKIMTIKPTETRYYLRLSSYKYADERAISP